MSSRVDSGNEFLRESYEQLGLAQGRLLDAGDSSRAVGVDGDTWTVTGEWLTLASRMGAEKVFFVGDDPVLLFAALPDAATPAQWIRAYRDAWCLARPQCVFLATPDELRVYALSEPPVAEEADWTSIEPLEVVRRAGDVAALLTRFERGQVESGEAFTGREFASRDHRADRQLLEDVRRATDQLIVDGLSPATAHSLIERVLLIRYLEHRGVVTPRYYEEVAAGTVRWGRALSSDPPRPIVNQNAPGLEAVLANKQFTFAVFERLARDFNGDLFVMSRSEQREVAQEHLDRIQGMLLGDTDPSQPPLFLWAYDFSIVPTSLISSMYEQFFHSATGDDTSGTHYTPPELVQFVVNEVLTPAVLETSPRVIDPSCGSGIFLVEAFRAVVRFEANRRGRRLRAAELRALLLSRIAGIDINAEGVRLAAFSLYLALLNYQRPQDILEAGPLPPLVLHQQDPTRTGILVVGNAFDPTPDEVEELVPLQDVAAVLPWRRETFDVVVGNPPWTEPRGKGKTQEDLWVTTVQRPVGDRSPSQAFIWRALSLLRPRGAVGLLVSAGVIANSRSQLFRSALLDEVTLAKVVNFSETRTFFFANATAPFLFMHLVATAPEPDSWFAYLTVRRSRALSTTGSLSFGRMDRRIVRQADVTLRDYLWKAYAWGSHHDANLMAVLGLEMSLGELLTKLDVEAGCGWQRGTKEAPPFIADLPELDIKRMTLWGPFSDDWLGPAPERVAFPTKEELYKGQRLIVTRRAYAGFGPRARLEQGEFTFRHTAYGVPLQDAPLWQAKVILGTMLSSLGRYCLFMRSGRWGAWHDEVTQEDLLAIPIRLPGSSHSAVRGVIGAIDALRALRPTARILADEAAWHERQEGVLARLDGAVFDLFELTDAQRDLVADFHATQLDFAEDRRRSGGDVRVRVGPRAGTFRTIADGASARGTLAPYLRTFLNAWNRELGPDGELRWQVHTSERPAILCVVFTTQPAEGRVETDLLQEWPAVLEGLEAVVDRPVGRELFVNGVLRAVTDTDIVIAKRDERRLWTASAAREDVEATTLRVIQLQQA